MATASIPIQPAYAVAKRVFEGELTPGEGSKLLHAKHGVNRNSARDLIAAYKHLMQGEVFDRGLSAPDMDFYLSRIGKEGGASVLRIALHSLWKHIRYYEGIRNITLRKLRGVAAKHEALAEAPLPEELLESTFSAAVEEALARSDVERSARLLGAPKKPERIPVVSLAFARNPDVVAQVLIDARGKCAGCKKPAPFKRKSDSTPYLEVHHKLPLALGGEDTVANAEALCPNCHRQRHFGAEA